MVEKEFQQLRFDISENIRLHPQKPGIGTLLELDLFPDVECKDEGKHLKIDGYLRLNGVYLGEEQTGEQQATHLEAEGREEIAYVIPVEITLPAERAEFDHISAEVESFDYSIVSPFELQITAMLLIDGILPEPEEEPERIESIREEPAFSAEPVELAFLSEKEEKDTETEQIKPQQNNTELEGKMDAPQDEQHQHRSADFVKQERSKTTESKESKSEYDIFLQPSEQPILSQEDQRNKEISKEDEEPLVKRSESVEVEEIIEQTNKSTSSEEGIERDREEDENEAKAIENDGKSPEWIRWLVRIREETYKPMRMVIVQRSQSVDYLADQYQVSREQLLAANGLKTDFIDEGAILYIPEERQPEARGL